MRLGKRYRDTVFLQLGNRDSSKFVHACGIGKEKDIQDGDDGSSG